MAPRVTPAAAGIEATPLNVFAVSMTSPLALVLLTFFNGQYYAQRVVGNYYIRETQRLGKQGIKHVELHAS